MSFYVLLTHDHLPLWVITNQGNRPEGEEVLLVLGISWVWELRLIYAGLYSTTK